MPSFFLDIQTEKVGKRSHAKAMRAAMRAVAIRHLRVIIPQHFQANPKTAPGGVYGYAKRNEKYDKRKERNGSSPRPLVLSDSLEKEQRRTSFASAVSATQKGATLRLKSPHHLKDQQWKELTATAESEIADHAEYAAKVYSDELEKLGARKSRKSLR